MDGVALHRWLPCWLRLAGHELPEGNLEQLKECLTALGINSRTWKLYAEYGDHLLRPLGPRWLSAEPRPQPNLANVLAYLRLLNACEVDMAPPPDLVRALGQCIPPGQPLTAMPVALFRGAWRALVRAQYHGVSSKTFIDSEFVPVMRWFFAHQTALEIDNTRTKAGWAWLRSRWAEEQRRRALPTGRDEWPVPVRNAQVGPLRFVPLQSAAALEDEGEVMRHCAGALVDCCRKGCIHMFSIRDAKTLERVATLAIRSHHRTWQIAQLKKVGNLPPEDSVVRAARDFLNRVAEVAAAPAGPAKIREDCLI